MQLAIVFIKTLIFAIRAIVYIWLGLTIFMKVGGVSPDSAVGQMSGLTFFIMIFAVCGVTELVVGLLELLAKRIAPSPPNDPGEN